jgi:hypothetical protein
LSQDDFNSGYRQPQVTRATTPISLPLCDLRYLLFKFYFAF